MGKWSKERRQHWSERRKQLIADGKLPNLYIPTNLGTPHKKETRERIAAALKAFWGPHNEAKVQRLVESCGDDPVKWEKLLKKFRLAKGRGHSNWLSYGWEYKNWDKKNTISDP